MRNYNKLFLGANEDGGKDNISLAYSVSAEQLIFYTDTHNIFTYPTYATPISLVQSNIIKDGAWGAASPDFADYIRYSKPCIPPGPYSMGNTFGKYLITWLYKDRLVTNKPAVWKDRWYNPEYISEKDALSVSLNSHPAVKDEDSIFQLEPGVEYDYFHMGNYFNRKSLSANDVNLTLFYENWNSTEGNYITENTTVKSDIHLMMNRDIPVIEMPYPELVNANNTTIRSVLADDIRTNNILDLTSPNAYAGNKFSDGTIINKNFSCSVWARSENWSDGDQYYLIGNGFRSGWNLIINPGFYDPVMTFISQTPCNIIGYNRDYIPIYGVVENNPEYDLTHTILSATSYIVDDKLFAYILAESHIYKVNLTNGLIVDQVSAVNVPNYKIYFDKNHDIKVLYKIGSVYRTKLYDYNLNLKSTSLPFSLSATDYLDIDLNGNLIGSSYEMSIDNYNNMWTARSDGLYRNDVLIYNASAIRIKCSHDDKLWAITKSDDGDFYNLNIYDISMVDTTLENDFLSLNADLQYSTQLPISQAITSPYILFDLMYTNQKSVGCIVDVFNNLMYKLKEDGSIEDIISFCNLSQLTNFNIGNFTTYDWNRKFNYIKNNRNPSIKLEFSTYDTLNNIVSDYSLNCSTNGLIDKEWHHIGFTIDNENSAVNLYLDTVLLSSIPFNGQDLYFKYETPILFGTGVGQLDLLSKELKNDDYDYFKGYIDEFRLYNTVLTQSDIETLYLDKFRFRDINFNIPTCPLYYLEEIERFFKFKLPGVKAPYYNIKISGLNVDTSTRQLIETIIKNTVKYVAPAYVELYKITWI